jgi:hypothetical protein
MAKPLQLFTVRHADGSRLGTLQAASPKHAIAAMIRAYSAECAGSRNQRMIKTDGITASVEPAFVFSLER